MADKIKIGGELDPRTPEKILGDASTIKDRTWELNHGDVAQTPNQKQDEINKYFQDQIDNIVATEQGGIQTDAAPTEGSVKIVQSGGTYTAIQNAATTAKTFSTGETVPSIGITPTPTNDTNKLVTSKGVKEAVENIAFSTNEKIKDVGIDSEPTVGSENLVKSGGNYNRLAEQEQKNIIVSWDNMMPINGWIGSAAFQLNGGKHAIIPVKGGDTITVRSTLPAFMFYIVKSYHIPTSEDLTVDFATGETARRDVGNTELTITLPSDAKYIVCTYLDSTNISRKPIYFFINGVDILNNTVEKIDIVDVDVISISQGGTTVPSIDKVSLATVEKTVYMRKFDGTNNYYPELKFANNTIFNVYGIKIVKDDGNWYLADKVACLDGIISTVTGKEPNKLYWHTTLGLIIKGDRDASSSAFFKLSLRGDEVLFYEGVSYIVVNGELTKVIKDDNITTAISTIKYYNKDNNLLNFSFITDTHSTNLYYNGSAHNMTFPGKSIAIVKKLSQEPNLIDYSIHGGDVLTTMGAKTQFPKSILVKAVSDNATFYKNQINNFIFVKGNHDNGHNDDAEHDLTNAEWKSYFQSGNNIPQGAVFGSEQDACYFYVDDDSKKVRLIVVDSWYEPYNSETMTFGSNQEQWLYETALDFTGKEGWSVIVVSHYWPYSDSTITQNPESVNVANIFKAFQNKGTQYGDYIFDVSLDTKLVAVVMGHAHQDMYNNSQGYNTIRVTRGFASPNEVSTDAEAAVDVFTIDTTNNILYETRIGRGSSHSYSFGDNPHQIS